MAERKAVTKQLARSYRAGDKARKGRILDEVVELTGWRRDYARTVLRNALDPLNQAVRPNRAPVYGADLQPALLFCWAVLRAPAGKLLAAMMPELVPMLREEKALNITDAQTELLRRMSAVVDGLPAQRQRTRDVRSDLVQDLAWLFFADWINGSSLPVSQGLESAKGQGRVNGQRHFRCQQ